MLVRAGLSRLGDAKLRTFALAIVALALAGWGAAEVIAFLRGDAPADSSYTMYICTETGKAFRHQNQLNESHPIYSPYTKKNTGVIAEPCFWTADGGTKTQPTWVLLNELAGKPGPTFCPECGRLVVGHNPGPGALSKAPPARAEYFARTRIAAKGSSEGAGEPTR
jgi:hypothetical protein